MVKLPEDEDRHELEMRDKPDGGCLSPADEEREPCLQKEKETAAAAAECKNNGTVAASCDDKNAKPADNNNSNGTGGKFHALAAATSLEQKLRDKTGFSRTGLIVAAVAVLLCVALLVTLVVLVIMWPRPPRPFSVCRRAACLRASAEVSCTHTHTLTTFVYIITRRP